MPTTPPELAYATTFHGDMIAVAQNTTIQPARPDTAALVAACYRHCNTENAYFSGLKVGPAGVSLEGSLVSWFFRDGTAPAYLVDGCAGFNCGAGCPAV